MLEFWIIVAVLTLLALIFVIPPLLSKNPGVIETDRNQLNVTIYQERLVELEQEDLTPEQRIQAKQELEKGLAQDLGNNTISNAKPRARWASVIVAVGIPALAVGSYLKLGASHLLTPENTPEVQAHQQQPGHLPDNFGEMVGKLEARLQKQPDDSEGWYMLARSYGFLKRYDQAAQAYGKVLALVGEQDPQLLTDFAEALALSNQGQFAGQPRILLKAALELEPTHQQALWLSGFAAMQKQDYQVAIDYWQRFLVQLSPEEVETRQMLEKYIAEARQFAQAQGEGTEVLATPPVDLATPEVEEDSATKTIATAQIEVHVRLDPSLQTRVEPDDTLFIYARARQGSPMPLAIVKKPARDLPTSVTLDDGMAMMPDMKLSNFKEITVLARLSKNGAARAQSGDLQGQVSPVVLGQQSQVEVVINQVVP